MSLTGGNGTADGNYADDDDIHPSMRRVIAIMVTRSMRKSAREVGQEMCQADHARAAVRTCGPRGIFCTGFVPWTHQRGIASARRGDMKSADVTEFFGFLWFCYDFSKTARAGKLQIFCAEALRF